MSLLWSYLKRYRQLVALALVLAAINQIFSLLDPLIFRYVIDRYATQYQLYTTAQFFRGVSMLLLAAVGVAFVSRVAKNFQDYFINVITQRLGAEIYADGIRHSLALPYQVFEDQRSGETLGILQKVRNDVEKLISQAINLLFTTLVGIIFVMIYAFSVHWIIAPVYLSTIPLLAVLSSTLSRRIKKIQMTIVAETTALAGSTTVAEEHRAGEGRGLARRKSRASTRRPIASWRSAEEGPLPAQPQFRAGHRCERAQDEHHVPDALPDLRAGDHRGAVLLAVHLLVLHFRAAAGAGKRHEHVPGDRGLARTVPEDPRHSARAQARSSRPVADLHRLNFQGVGFSHLTAAAPALTDDTFQVARGETIAFVGPSGAGKTTLVKLLVGLYRPQSGRILYDGHPHDSVDLDILRERIGFVRQETQLFSGSIRENLRFVRPEATDEECLASLHAAACESLLARADRGLDTVIGEGGVKVSGGERQRLSIARALLRRPHLLVFDEATSSLDSITEEEISLTIREVDRARDAITILIAHRLSTIMHADRIYVLERGRIVEQGGHDELLAQRGLYYAMWRQQVGERRRAVTAPSGVPPTVAPAAARVQVQ
jgi:ATP-binding cassette subfamily B protein